MCISFTTIQVLISCRTLREVVYVCRYGAHVGLKSNYDMVFGIDQTKTIMVNHIRDMVLYMEKGMMVSL